MEVLLQQESERHHHELTSLQTLHTQQLHTLSHQYREQIGSLNDQLQQQDSDRELMEHLSGDKGKCQELYNTNQLTLLTVCSSHWQLWGTW